MIYLVLLVASYTAFALMVYSASRNTDIPKSAQIKYSIAWPWLFIATAGCALWDYFSPVD